MTFLDRRRGWAVGAASFGFQGEKVAIVATTDGGTTWQDESPSQVHASLYAVAFADSQHGWAVGRFGTMLATDDGGGNWHRRNAGTGGSLHDVAFADSEHGWVVGASGLVLSTSNGGRTWARQDFGTRRDLNAVAFVDGRGWIVGDGGLVFRLDLPGGVGH